MNILLISLYDEWCLGQRALSAYLRRGGHEVAIAQLGSHADALNESGFYALAERDFDADFKAIRGLVERYEPRVIGIGVGSECFGVAARLTEFLHGHTKAPIVWGGIDPTANPDLAIKHADVVCIGEGEGAMADIVERVGAGRPLDDVANLWVRKDGEVVKNDVRPLIQDLDSLPFPDFEPKNKFYVSNGKAEEGALPTQTALKNCYPMMGSRGCPGSCSYCCNGLLRALYGAKGYVRVRSVGSVLDEIENARRINPGIEAIGFWDDVFGINRKWLEEFVREYPRRIGLPFYCYIHPSMCPPWRVELLKQAGVAFVTMGIQSGSQRVLKEVYQRNTPREKILETMAMLRDAGIHVVIDMIAHNPLETEEDYRESLDLMLDMPKGFGISLIGGLITYRSYPIEKIMRDNGVPLDWVTGGNWAAMPNTPDSRFWRAVLGMTEFESMPAETLRAMVDDPYLREHPEITEGLFSALRNAYYLPGTNRRRSDLLDEQRHELARLKGSRAIRAFLRVKAMMKRFTGS